MMQPSEERHRGDLPDALNGARDRRVLLQREVSPHFIIVSGVGSNNATQVRFTEHHAVVDALGGLHRLRGGAANMNNQIERADFLAGMRKEIRQVSRGSHGPPIIRNARLRRAPRAPLSIGANLAAAIGDENLARI